MFNKLCSHKMYLKGKCNHLFNNRQLIQINKEHISNSHHLNSSSKYQLALIKEHSSSLHHNLNNSIQTTKTNCKCRSKQDKPNLSNRNTNNKKLKTTACRACQFSKCSREWQGQHSNNSSKKHL